MLLNTNALIENETMRPCLLDGKVFSNSPHHSGWKLLKPAKFTPHSQSDRVYRAKWTCVGVHWVVFLHFCLALNIVWNNLTIVTFLIYIALHDYMRAFKCKTQNLTRKGCVWPALAAVPMHLNRICYVWRNTMQSRSNASFKLSSMESIEVNRNLITFVWGCASNTNQMQENNIHLFDPEVSYCPSHSFSVV